MHHSEAWNLVQNLDLELNLNLAQNLFLERYPFLVPKLQQFC